MSYQRIKLYPVSATIGAEVKGVDLSEPLDEATFKEIEQAWLDYLVLFFPDQELTPDQFKDFVGRFGDFEHHPFIDKIEGDLDVEKVEFNKQRAPMAPPTDVLHIDVSMMEIPTKGAALYAVDVMQAGGDTIWVNLYAAYDALSDPMKEFLLGKTGLFSGLHDKALNRLVKGGAEAFQKAGSFMKQPSEHPLVHSHPETGKKALFVDSLFLWSIEGLHDDESETIINFLNRHITKPEFQCRFHWRPGSLAIWDNRCTMHKRVDDIVEGTRSMYRLPLLGTEKPAL